MILQALAFSIDDNTILLSILNVLRNLSFDVSLPPSLPPKPFCLQNTSVFRS